MELDIRQSQYTIDECLAGQRYKAMYDPLRAMTMRPDLRKGTINTFSSSSIEGLFSQIQYITGNEKRRVKTREYYTMESTNEGGMTVVVAKNPTVPAAGANVTLTIDTASHSSSGTLSLPSAGYHVYVNGSPTRKLYITSVNKASNGAHTITLTPLNGEVADFSLKDRYTLTVSRMKTKVAGDTACFTGNNFVPSPPTLRKHYVQKYVQTYCLQEDELNNYVYTQHAMEVDMVDGFGQKWSEWSEPKYTQMLMKDIQTNRIMETLFGIRDNINEIGFDGLIPTAEKNSFLNQVYDPAQGASFYQLFMNMVRRIRGIRGCNEYLLAHDFKFGLDWNTGITELVKGFTGSNHYSLLGPGKAGARDLEMPTFDNFKINNTFTFRRYQIDMFDDPKFGGNLKENFALMMPLCKFKDTNGKDVPIVTYTGIEGSEQGPDMQIFTVDKRRTMNCPEIDFVAKDLFGLEIHGAGQLAVMQRLTC